MASSYEVTAHLALLNYPVTVLTSPPSSVVILDGKDGGITNGEGILLLPNVDRGIHQLVVSHQGYRDAAETIRVYGRSAARIELLNLAEAARQEAEAHQREINEHLDRARALFHQAQYQSAQDECDAALKLDPANAAAQALKKQIEQTRKILGR